MLRTSLLIPLAALVLLRENLCTALFPPKREPCEYEVIELATDIEMPWGTTPAEDLAVLEVPTHGTWTWGESSESIDIEQSGVVLPAWASFVHDPDTLRTRDQVGGGGRGVFCYGATVLVDGTLTVTDEQGAEIISVPVTAERSHQVDDFYRSMPEYSPIAEFSPELHAKAEFDRTRIAGLVLWAEDSRLFAHFDYNGQTMIDESNGRGVVSFVGMFESDE